MKASKLLRSPSRLERISDSRRPLARRVGGGSARVARTVGSATASAVRHAGGSAAAIARRVGPRRGLIGLGLVAALIGAGVAIMLRHSRRRALSQGDQSLDAQMGTEDPSHPGARRRRGARSGAHVGMTP